MRDHTGGIKRHNACSAFQTVRQICCFLLRDRGTGVICFIYVVQEGRILSAELAPSYDQMSSSKLINSDVQCSQTASTPVLDYLGSDFTLLRMLTYVRAETISNSCLLMTLAGVATLLPAAKALYLSSFSWSSSSRPYPPRAPAAGGKRASKPVKQNPVPLFSFRRLLSYRQNSGLDRSEPAIPYDSGADPMHASCTLYRLFLTKGQGRACM